MLARLRSERRNALRLARAAGSADAYASLALPSTARSAVEADPWLQPTAWFELEARISAVSMLPAAVAPAPRLHGNVTAQYFVLGDTSGKLHFYSCLAEPLLPAPYNTGHTAAITAIGFGRRDSSLLVTAAADGTIRFHNFARPVPVRALVRAAGDAQRGGGPAKGLLPPPPAPTPMQASATFTIPALYQLASLSPAFFVALLRA